MTDKRRGLGRGLGALIPSAPPQRPGERPVDVFFPQGDAEGFTGNTDTGRAGPEAPGGPDSARADADDTGAVDGGTEPAAGDGRSAASSPHAAGAPVPAAADLVPVPGASFAEIPIDRIRANPRQPRQVFDPESLMELEHSIREVGVLQPVVVRRVHGQDGEQDSESEFELVMGERRWRASQQAGLARIPAIIRNTQDDDLLRDALLENLHRSELNPLEEAAAYQQLLDDFGCTHDELAQRIGRSRPQISNTLRLMKLPPLVQRRVAAGVLSAGHARALLGLTDAAAMERLAQRIVAEGLSVRSTEEIVAIGGDGSPAPPVRHPVRAGDRHAALDELAARLSDRLDTRVKIALGQRKGRLTVEFATVEDLNRIVGVLAPQDEGVFRD